MPKKKRQPIGQVQPKAKKAKANRKCETNSERRQRLQALQKHASNSRSSETRDQREQRLGEMKTHASTSRASESQDQREQRLGEMRTHASISRASESQDKREHRLEKKRILASTSRASESQDQREQRLGEMRTHASISRASESQDQREQRLGEMRTHASISRASESQDQREQRLGEMRTYASTSRASESQKQRKDRLIKMRTQASKSRATECQLNLFLEGFHYNPCKDYSKHKNVLIGGMNKICKYCFAKKYENEPPGLCCCNGKVKLPMLEIPPEPLFSYMSGSTPESRHFLKNIRRYNSCFQMTSFGATSVVGQRGFETTFKVQGQIYHKAGSLLPLPNEDSKFLQIYFTGDEEMEVNQRCNYITGIRRDIVLKLQRMFHEHNILIKTFKTALEGMPTDEYKLVISADKRPAGQHERRFNSPEINEVAIIVEDGEYNSRDIVLQRRGGSLQRIAETHRLYDSLQYPILFWQGEDGYHFNILQYNPSTESTIQKRVSMMNFYAYRIMIRHTTHNHILNARHLFHQFVVDVYAKIEAERLIYIKLNQKKLRSEEYIHLKDAVATEKNVTDIGKMVILPATFTGSPRQMHEYAQDAMTYVRLYGRPDLFITLTCNPSWPEIKEELIYGQKPHERHDLLARVFRQKQQKLINVLTKSQIFGEVRCWMYSVEWQKRGLPHSHNLIWLKNKIHHNQIDDIISAEIPDPELDPILCEIIKKHMIHGPCGYINPNSPCMENGRCTKLYPRQLIKETQSGHDGYPKYRRRSPEDGGHCLRLNARGEVIEIDNKWVVPYSPLLSKMFEAHINVEYCSSIKSIKYICKYINKGSDMAVFGLTKANEVDEVTNYQMGRYISSNEAIWRILSFPIHERHPTVIHLSVHLENGQRVYFTRENAEAVAAKPPRTTLTAFFELCQRDAFARTLLYPEVPRYYTWDSRKKVFSKRKKGVLLVGEDVVASEALGRVYTIHPSNAECFFLRMLLHTVRGPTSWEILKTVNGEVCNTFREACQKLGLLEDDEHWEKAMCETALRSSPNQIRNLFAIILTTCSPSSPRTLWEKFRESMSEDILSKYRHHHAIKDIQFSPEIFNRVLNLLEDKCLSICGKTLLQLGLPAPIRNSNKVMDVEFLREKNYNVDELKAFVERNRPLLMGDQLKAYEAIVKCVEREEGGIIFLDAPGGTGKTFLINLILAEIRSKTDVALAMASSGIAATLLDGGRTVHSALKLPLNINIEEVPVCNISKTSGQAKVLQQCKIIVWDECSMAHKKALEALDRTMRDLRRNDQLMGGTLLLLAGDFRQTLPVVANSTPADELNACLKASPLWKHVRRYTLRCNMRVQMFGDKCAEQFANTILEIGEGILPTDLNSEISIPKHFCTQVATSRELIESIYPDISHNYKNHKWLCERAILAAKNDAVHELNRKIQEMIPGTVTEYKSIDTVVEDDDTVNYPVEFLNSLEPNGIPPHRLQLKKGSVIMLLRNLDPPKLCNGTRLSVKRLLANVIEATIITGKNEGQDVFIPRVPLIPSDLPFQFRRLQFPVRLAFAITINKSQGQTIKWCGVNLEYPCFSHGQLYVACSRVGSPKHLFLRVPRGKTKNIVYKKALMP